MSGEGEGARTPGLGLGGRARATARKGSPDGRALPHPRPLPSVPRPNAVSKLEAATSRRCRRNREWRSEGVKTSFMPRLHQGQGAARGVYGKNGRRHSTGCWGWRLGGWGMHSPAFDDRWRECAGGGCGDEALLLPRGTGLTERERGAGQSILGRGGQQPPRDGTDGHGEQQPIH
eukprot:scaffold4181_cov54-Isochrysis_galbana.AAC.1